MSITIDQAFITAYSGNVHHLSQQTKSRLREAVTLRPGQGEAVAFERLGKAEFTQKTSRHSPTPRANFAHTRRLAIMQTWGQGETVDKDDEALALITPQSEYVKGLLAAGERDFDRKVINAMNGNAAQGHDTGSITQVALPAAQKIAHGNAQMTVAKALQARRLLAKAQGWFNASPKDRYIMVGSDMVHSLFTESGEIRLTSGDYNQRRPLMEGEILWWLGMNWIEVDDSMLPADPLDTTKKLVYAWIKQAVGVGISQPLRTEVGVSPDNRFSTIIYHEHSLNAVRIEDEGVVEISCVLPA